MEIPLKEISHRQNAWTAGAFAGQPAGPMRIIAPSGIERGVRHVACELLLS